MSSSSFQLNRAKKRGRSLHEAHQSSFLESSCGRSRARGCYSPNIDATEHISEEEKSKFVALDCEMVSVGRESTLARVSIVNWHGEILINTFVRVENEVTDYLTRISGIRACDIKSKDAMSFTDCQEAVKIILSGKVVVGHALKNDFRALNITHPWYLTRDTAKYEPYMKPSPVDKNILLPRKLKFLAEKKLGMIIQEYGKEHDSIEDAIAAMELYKMVRRKWENAMEWKRRKTNKIERKRKQKQ